MDKENDRDYKDRFITVTVKDGGLTVEVDRILKNVKELRPALEEFHTRMVTRIDRTFDLAGAPGSVEKGGVDPFRDITWEPLAAKRRKADGLLIPAWGGIPRLDGKGVTKGRLRPSGKRVTKGDALNQDSGRYRQRIATGYVAITRDRLTFGPNLNYSESLESIRPALFISESDADLFEKLLNKHILGIPLDEREEL